MPRPKKLRWVAQYPTMVSFAPQGIPATGDLKLSVEEFESLRLSDFEGLDQAAAADRMQISRQTYGRILARARGLVAEALVTGKAMSVGGGTFEMRGRGRGWRHRGRGRRGRGQGP